MTLLSARDLGVTFAEPLFSQFDLTIAKGDRIGLVAANGRGKSTLLKILAGQTEPTFGEVTRSRGLRVGLVTQDVPHRLLALPLYGAVLDALDPEARDYESWRVDIVLDDLAVPHDLRDRPLGALSGGWQRVTLLARTWATEPDLLLMDEPTNHLDLHRIGLLQHWLATAARDVPFLVASHDRAFLDAVTTKTLFLRATKSQSFALGYSPARAALTQADEAEARRFDNEMAKADQLRRQAAKLKNIGINSGSDLLITKTKQLRDRAEKIEDAARPAFQDKSAGAIRLANSGTHAKALVSLEDLPICAPDGRLLFRTGQMWITRGDRVVVLGPNGAGKTQLLTRVMAALAAGTAGVDGIRVAPTLRPGISDQSLSQLNRFRSPWEAVTLQSDVGDQRARSLLAGAGMSVAMQEGAVAALSGGQKARLAMLLLRLGQPNFYVLDEPTNHLDIEGQEMLETELQEHEATALVVSHDRTFVRAVGTRFWRIDGKRLHEVDSPDAFFADQLGGP